ncbi:MAG: hypothetical protein EBW47_10845 [Betaproteobacteria bacterium]|nr:hypothetical protein [Betaproteobacteria bacterium]
MEALFPETKQIDEFGRTQAIDGTEQFSTSEASPSADDPKAWEQAAWELNPRNSNDSDDEDRQRDWRSTEDLLSDHLKQQLIACRVTERDRALVQWLIDALDEDGMLREPIASICERKKMFADQKRHKTLLDILGHDMGHWQQAPEVCHLPILFHRSKYKLVHKCRVFRERYDR